MRKKSTHTFQSTPSTSKTQFTPLGPASVPLYTHQTHKSPFNDLFRALAETERLMISEQNHSTETTDLLSPPLYFRIMTVTCCHGFRLNLSLLCVLRSVVELVIWSCQLWAFQLIHSPKTFFFIVSGVQLSDYSHIMKQRKCDTANSPPRSTETVTSKSQITLCFYGYFIKRRFKDVSTACDEVHQTHQPASKSNQSTS